jgi:uncharacterized membrane protein
MNNQNILLIIFGTAFICYTIERKIAWISHVSSVCLLILFAMLLSQIGIVPKQSELYDFLQGPLLLIALVMMIVGLQLNDILKIPMKIILIFIMGAFGSILGGLFSGYIASKELGVDAYKLAAQLTASYIGGGENAAAMQKIYDIPHNYFVAVFAVDNIVTTLWLVFAICFGNDKNKEVSIIEHDTSNYDGISSNIISIMACLFVSLGVVVLAGLASQYIGYMHKILWISIFALIIGQISILKEYLKSAYIIGSIIFSGFFFSMGAISDLREVLQLPIIIIAMPFIVVSVQAIFIISGAYLFKMSRISTMITSQALIGGPATAVAVAQARKWDAGITIGIILGVFGYATANFLGVFVYNILQFIEPK